MLSSRAVKRIRNASQYALMPLLKQLDRCHNGEDLSCRLLTGPVGRLAAKLVSAAAGVQRGRAGGFSIDELRV